MSDNLIRPQFDVDHQADERRRTLARRQQAGQLKATVTAWQFDPLRDRITWQLTLDGMDAPAVPFVTSLSWRPGNALAHLCETLYYPLHLLADLDPDIFIGQQVQIVSLKTQIDDAWDIQPQVTRLEAVRPRQAAPWDPDSQRMVTQTPDMELRGYSTPYR